MVVEGSYMKSINSFMKNQTAEMSLAILLILITIADRMHNIGKMGLWPDEVFTASLAYPDHTLYTVIKGALSTPIPAPPLIYVVSHIWMKIVGFDDVLIRIPFVIAGAMGIPAIYLAGRSLFSKRVGIVSATLLFFSSMHIFHSREARYYPFLFLFSTLSIFFLNQAINFEDKKWWAGYVIFSILNIYTFHTALFVLAAQGIYILYLALTDILSYQKRSLKSWGESPLGKYTLSLIIIFLFYLPLLPYLLGGLNSSRGYTSQDLSGRFTADFFIKGLIPNFFGTPDTPINIFLIFFAAGLFLYIRKNYHQTIYIIIISIFPFIVLQQISIRHWVEYKYFMFILPLFLIVIAQGIENAASLFSHISKTDNISVPLWENMLSILFLIVVLSVNSRYYGRGFVQYNSLWREQGAFVNQVMGPGDLFVTFKISSNRTIHTKEMFSIYFDPINNPQEIIPIVGDSDGLANYLEQFDHVFFHHGPIEPKFLEDIYEWIDQTVHIKMKFGNYSIFYIGKNTSRNELLDNLRDYKKFIDHDDY